MSWLQSRRRRVPAGVQAVSRLVDGLVDADPRVRARSARGCGAAGAEVAVPLLRERLLDPDSAVRGAAAAALGQIGGVRCADALMRSLRTRRLAPARLCRELARSAPDFYLEMAVMRPENRQVRAPLALALGLRGPSPMVGSALSSLLDGDESERAAAYHSLGALGRAAAIPLLVRALTDDSPRIQRAAGRALLRLGEPGPVHEAMGDAFQRRRQPAGRRRRFLGLGWRWSR